MSMRTAMTQSSLVTVLVVLGAAWTALTAVNVAGSLGAHTSPIYTYVGQNWIGGLIGLAVLVAIVFLFGYAYSELSEVEPTPETFPPEE